MKKYILAFSALLMISCNLFAQNKMIVNLKNGVSNEYSIDDLLDVVWEQPSAPGTDENDPDETSVTGGATDISFDSAVITCYANIYDNLGGGPKVGVFYCTEGTPSANNGKQIFVDNSDIAEDGKYTINLTKLTDATTYYYRSCVYQSGLWFLGKVRQFTTKGNDLAFPYGENKITCYSAKISYSLNTSHPDYPRVSKYGVCYSKEPSPTTQVVAEKKDKNGNFTTVLTRLEGSTTYYYRYFVEVSGTIYYGETLSFTTSEDNVVETGDADAYGNIKSKLTIGSGSYSNLEVGILWKCASDDSIGGQLKTDEIDDESNFEITPNWYMGPCTYRAYVKIDYIMHYGETKTFTPDPNLTPVGNAVDLGLSVKWADMNIGASKPEGFGFYYSWGEVEPKTEYTTESYFEKFDSYSMQKYNQTNKKLAPEDDVAHVKWGGDWRMPTKGDFNELCKKCVWKWVKRNGAYGYDVKGPSGKSIFLPAANVRSGKFAGDVGLGTHGEYWTSDIYETNIFGAYSLYISDPNSHTTDWQQRYQGLVIRPVCK